MDRCKVWCYTNNWINFTENYGRWGMKTRFLGTILVGTLCMLFLVANAWAKMDKIKVGVIGPYSGPVARYGILSQRNPITLAAEEINKKGGINGIPIEVIFEDDEADPVKTATVARKLITRDNVIALFGPPMTGGTLGALKVSTEAEIVLFSPECVSPAVGSVGGRWVFNGGFMPEDETVTLLMITMDRCKKYGFLSDNSGYGLTTRDYFIAKAKEMGRPFALVETADIKAVDLTPHMLKFKEAGCDAVVVMGYAPAMATAAKTAKTIDYRPQFLFGFGACLTELLDIGGDAVVGCIYGDMLDPERRGVKEYLAAMEKKFGKDGSEIQGPGTAAYSMFYMMTEGLKAIKLEGSPQEISKRLRDWVELNVRDWDKYLLAGKKGSKWTFTRFKRNGPAIDFIALWTVKKDASTGKVYRTRFKAENE
jgi:branched-chain amino acid transport system substrate-binding protein